MPYPFAGFNNAFRSKFTVWFALDGGDQQHDVSVSSTRFLYDALT